MESQALTATNLPLGYNPNRMGLNTKTAFNSSAVPRRAYVTRLAGDGVNLGGVVGLAEGLRKVNSEYPLVVVIHSGVSTQIRDILVNRRCHVEEIQPGWIQGHSTELSSLLRIFRLEQYQRLIYLKPGMEVIGNTDELFELPEEGHFYAVPNSFYGDKIGYCPISNPAKLGSESPLSFNTEMFVFQPSLDTFNALNHKLLAKKAIIGSGPGNIDQLLNSHFGDTYQPLDPIYNFNVDFLCHHPDKLHHAKVLGSGVGMLLKKVREEIEEVKSLDDDDTTITTNSNSSAADQKKERSKKKKKKSSPKKEEESPEKKKSKWSSFKEWLSALLPCCGCCGCIGNCIQQQTGGIDFGSVADGFGAAFS